MTTRELILLSTLLGHTLVAESTLSDWWQEHGSYNIRNLSSAFAQHYAKIPLNTDNLLNLPQYSLVNEFRPEASISYERAYFHIAPRFVARDDRYEDGAYANENHSDTETYIHEWTAQFFLNPELSISYGREDLQWGPAFLLSPSNPFDSKNGRSEPKAEVDAADYAKIIWTPNYNWTLSFIASTDDGRKDYRLRKELRQSFKDSYALKVDYVFDRGLAAVIASTTDDADDIDERLGYYASYNLSDAWLTYFEGSLSSEDEELLLGASYTTNSGINLTAEYFYNSSGIDDEIPDNPADLIDLADYITSIPNREMFSRENYLLLQAYQNDIIGSLDLLLRYTHNIDDQSRSLLGHLEVDLNDYASFFTSATINSSGGGELDSLREYWIQAGIELSF